MRHGNNVKDRLSPRYLINRSAELLDMNNLASKLSYHVCMLVDISSGGAKIRSCREYTPGQMLTVRAGLYDGHKHIQLRGRIVRVDGLPSGWREYGVRFEGLSDSHKEALEQGLACVVRCREAFA